MILLVFLFGLAFGSFINVLIYRLPKDLSLSGRSFCPGCKKQIAWYDNIPLFSFLALKGRCRKCGDKISLGYPLVEFVSAAGFVLIHVLLPNLVLAERLLIYFIFVLTLAVFVIDLKHQIIPDVLILLGYPVLVAFILLSGNRTLFTHLLSGFISGLFLLSLHFVTGGKGMGLGDVKLAVFLGTFYSLPLTVVWMMMSFMTGAVFGIILMLMGMAKLRSRVAFGPFMVLSFWLVLFLGESIVKLLLR